MLSYRVATISKLLKIIDLFCKRALEKRLYLQKRLMILRSLLIVATPCHDLNGCTYIVCRCTYVVCIYTLICRSRQIIYERIYQCVNVRICTGIYVPIYI